jgi:AcrR family transcriptional regulator
VPKLWEKSIDAHRQAVRDATLDSAASLIAERGLAAVTMSQIAQATGIGRATLYKYFPDVESILSAWHERQVNRHLAHLREVKDRTFDPAARLGAVLEAYALLLRERRGHQHDDTPLVARLHAGARLHEAQRELHQFVRDLVATAAASGDVRRDVAPGELASFSLSALTAARHLPSTAAVRRLVALTLDAMRPPADR